MSYGSRRVLDVLTDVVALEPDLVPVYRGNNEYIERNALTADERRGGWLPGARDILRRTATCRELRFGIFNAFPSFLRRPDAEDLTDMRRRPLVRRGAIGRTPELDLEVLETYRRNLEETARLLERREVPAVSVTVPVNLAQWNPLGLPLRLETDERAHLWKNLVTETELAFAAIDLDGARTLPRKMLELAPAPLRPTTALD